MRQQFGETRSSIRDLHALMCPDSHERTSLPNWSDALIVFVIAPQMGAGFTQYFVEAEDGATGTAPLDGVERFFMVLDGHATLSVGSDTHDLSPEGYALVPAGADHAITARGATRLVVYERHYVALQGIKKPALVVGSIEDCTPVPMKGDDRLMLQKLLPEEPAFDCEFNIMDFSPGASLPYVETHFMEHGLLMLNGGGVYRLDSEWYPVEAGDVIWMGPYCAQWFGAIGSENTRYLIYKNRNRDPLATA